MSFHFFLLVMLVPVVINTAEAQVRGGQPELLYTRWKSEERRMLVKQLQLEESEKAGFWNIYESYSRAVEFMQIRYVELMAVSEDSPNLKSSGQKRQEMSKIEDLIARRRREYYIRLCKVLDVAKADQVVALDRLSQAAFRMLPQLQTTGLTSDPMMAKRELTEHQQP